MDKITELQEELQNMSNLFVNSIGILQLEAGKDESKAKQFVQEIAKSKQTFETLIDGLPDIDLTEAEQNKELMELERENQEWKVKLEQKHEEMQNRLQLVSQSLKITTQDD